MLTPSRYKQNPQQLSNSRQYNSKCVCQICTCGKHHCPERATKFEGQTTNHHDYKAYKVVAQQGSKCQHVHQNKHYDPELLKSSYNAAYTPYRIDRECPASSKYEYQPNKAKFEGETQYKKNYIPNDIHVERPHTAYEYVPNKAKFDGTTTYNREYSPKKFELSPQKKFAYERKQIPFEGKTTYDSEYKPYKVEANRPDTGNHQGHYIPNKAKFEGTSRYNEFYQPYQIEQHQNCPVINLPPRPRQCSPGKTHLDYSAEKNTWE